jgi:peptidyl-tRNA hydrolase, PTH1 family
MQKQLEIKALVGLGNPGSTYAYTPHNIGFLILDKLCADQNGTWELDHNMLVAFIQLHGKPMLLVKPQTFMNNSGEILKYLNKRGIKQDNLLVIHDEIDFPFGKVTIKEAGSARGHNGLRSLISYGGENFLRLRCGVGRSEQPAEVGKFVTSRFEQSTQEVDALIEKAITVLHKTISEMLSLHDLANSF